MELKLGNFSMKFGNPTVSQEHTIVPTATLMPPERAEKAVGSDDRTASTPIGFSFDDSIFDWLKSQEGMRKPTNIAFETLRKLNRSMGIANNCKTILKRRVNQTPWDIIAKGDNKVNEKDRQYVIHLLQNPTMNNISFRSWSDGIMEDILDLDAGVFEKVRTRSGTLCQMIPRDGATIRPRYTNHGEAQGYVQINPNSGKVMAEWDNNDMTYIMQNPQLSMQLFGYGLAPMEGVIMAATAVLLGDDYNTSYFNQATVPQGFIDLGPGVSNDQVAQFQKSFYATMQGGSTGAKWRTPIGSFPDFKYIPVRSNNQEMQFYEFTLWFANIVINAFGLSKVDLNITDDVNRATADQQGASSEKKGDSAMRDTMKEYIDREIIDDPSLGLGDVMEFKYLDDAQVDPEKQAKVLNSYVVGGILTQNEARAELGKPPVQGGERLMVMTKSGPVFFDSRYIENMSDAKMEELRFAELLPSGGEGEDEDEPNDNAGDDSDGDAGNDSAGTGKGNQDKKTNGDPPQEKTKKTSKSFRIEKAKKKVEARPVKSQLTLEQQVKDVIQKTLLDVADDIERHLNGSGRLPRQDFIQPSDVSIPLLASQKIMAEAKDKGYALLGKENRGRLSTEDISEIVNYQQGQAQDIADRRNKKINAIIVDWEGEQIDAENDPETLMDRINSYLGTDEDSDTQGYAANGIAVTGLQWAVIAGLASAFRENKVDMVDWINGDNPCPICIALAAGGPYTVAEAYAKYPPHNHCYCEIAPST